MNRSETLIVTAVVALAMLPRFEAGVQRFVADHRSEIQLAVAQVQGLRSAPGMLPAQDSADEPQVRLAYALPPAPPAFAQSVSVPAIPAPAARLGGHAPLAPPAVYINLAQLQHLQPQLAGLRALSNVRMVSAKDRSTILIYRNAVKRCPAAPGAPAAPVSVEINTATTGY